MTSNTKRKSLLVLVCLLVLVFTSSVFMFFSNVKTGQAEKATSSFSVLSDASSVRYGSHSTYQTDKQGLVVSLAKDDKLHFNRVIDLNNKKATDNIVSLFITPNAVGASDAHFLVMHFTDAYDPENEITVTCWDPWQDGWGADHIYMYAYKKLDAETAGRSCIYAGTIYKNSLYGTEGLVSFSGQEASGALVGSREVTVSFDYQERQVFGTKYNTPNPLIADFDSTDYFTQMWDGFTTGEVFLSIEAGNYKGSTFNFVVTNIAGYDLSEKDFTTTRAPEITIDQASFGGGKSFNAPIGKKIPLPKFSAYSIYDKNLTTSQRVLKDDQEITVSDNSFVAQTAGEYKIVYSAIDKFDNKTEEVITVNALSQFDNVNLVLYEEVKEFIVGEEKAIAGALEFGGDVTGTPTLKITATLIGNPNVVYEINANDLSFKPQYTGEYVVRYEYSDYLQSGVKIRKIKVVSSDSAYIYELPVLPDYFIKNAKHILPDAYGYTYVEGVPAKVKADIYAVADDGTETKIDNVYKVTASEKVKLIYRVYNGNKTDELSKEIKVVDVNYGRQLSIVKYFEVLSGEVNATADENSAQFTFANDGLMEFINPVQSENFQFAFSMLGENFESFDIYLVDSIHPDEQIKITYTKYNETRTLLSINDSSTKYGLDGSLMKDDTFSFTYTNKTKALQVTSRLSPPIYTYLNGQEFNGFSSSIVKIYLGVNGIEEDTTLKISRINNQPIYDLKDEGDVMKPEFFLTTMRGDRVKGEVITITPMVIKDVLDPYVDCSISVTDPNGNYVVDSNGVTLHDLTDYAREYSYTLTEFGGYVTSITMKDGSLNKAIFGYQNIVIDKVEPTLTLNGKIKETAKLGDTVTVPSAKAIDDIDKKLDVHIYLVVPNLEMYCLTESRAFKASMKGTYKVIYYTVDESGNMSSSVYTITVE